MMALEAGKPAVVSDLETLKAYLDPGESALTVPPGDAEALARALVQLYEDDTLARLERGATRLRSAFTWEIWVEKILTFFSSRGILDP